MLLSLNPSLSKDRLLAAMVGKAYLEIIPTSTILDRVVHLPQHAYVSITCSPAHGVEPTLELTEKLRALPEERRLKLVPHIAARVVRDRGHLREILARLDAFPRWSVYPIEFSYRAFHLYQSTFMARIMDKNASRFCFCNHLLDEVQIDTFRQSKYLQIGQCCLWEKLVKGANLRNCSGFVGHPSQTSQLLKIIFSRFAILLLADNGC